MPTVNEIEKLALELPETGRAVLASASLETLPPILDDEDEATPQLADEFYAEVRQFMTAAARNPRRFAVRQRDIRRVNLDCIPGSNSTALARRR